MSDKPTPEEESLARRVGALADASARPKIENGGYLGDALNFLTDKVPVRLIRLGILLFIGFYAWQYYQRAIQLSADVGTKNAEAARLEVEAQSQTEKIGSDSIQAAKLKAELEQLEADARSAEAEARAAAQTIGDGPARLKELEADMERAQADADRANAEIDAQNQVIAGIPIYIAQKKAEIDAAEGEAQAKLNSMKLLVEAYRSGNLAAYMMNQASGSIFGGAPPVRTRSYSIAEIFNELHGGR